MEENLNYEPSPYVDFGAVCHPEPWEIRTCHGGVGDGDDCTDSDTDCGAPDICILDDPGGIGQDCTDPPNIGGANICQPYRFDRQFLNAFECYAKTDNRLASTDGPTAGGGCFGSGPDSMQADVWYTVTAPCEGKAIIVSCDGAEYESMFAVFGDHSDSPRCPGLGDDNDDLIFCNHDYCEHAGSGISWQATEGAVYLLRMAGWSNGGSDADAGQGRSEMHIGFYCEPTPAFEPLTLPAIPQHRHRKHRYISINPKANPLEPTVIKVEITEMMRCQNDVRRGCNWDTDCPAVCDTDPKNTLCPTGPGVCGGNACIDSGPCVDATPNPPVAWLVQEPEQLPPGCIPSCADQDWIARLSDNPYADANNWQDHDLIHIGDCGVSPGITYAVYACEPANTNNCSAPVYVATQPTPSGPPRHFGDIAGAVLTPGGPFEPPDGFVNVVDISAWGLTKQNYGTATQPRLHPTMADIHGPGYGIPPN